MDKIFSYINSNNICQIDVPKYGSANNIPYEFNIPYDLVIHNKKVVVCLPDNYSLKLYYEYMKNLYPEIRIGYADIKDVSYNLSTQINYITQRYLKYKLLHHKGDYTKLLNFADIIIIFNPDMNDNNNIFSISIFKYNDDNNILFPKLCIINSKYTFKLTEKHVFFKDDKSRLKCFDINNIDNNSIIKNTVDIIKSNYYKYQNEANLLIYVSNIKTAVSINNILKIILSGCKIYIICSDYVNTINTFSEIFKEKTKKIIIAVDFKEFYFHNIDLIIDTINSKQENFKILKKEQLVKDLSHLIIDYVKCDIPLMRLPLKTITEKFSNINVKNTIGLLKNLNLLIDNDDKLLISAVGIFFETIKLSPVKTFFLWEWISMGNPIYEGLIIILLIDESLPLIDLVYHQNWIGISPLHTYLNMLQSFTSSNKNNIQNIIKNFDKDDILICKNWAIDNKIHHIRFMSLITNISNYYNKITKELRNVNISINNFNIESIIEKSLAILTKIYFMDILIIKNNAIVQPHNNIKYLLNRNCFKNNLTDNKIIPLSLRLTKNNSKNELKIKTVYIDNFIII